MSFVKLQWVTPNAEFQMAFIARGSNPPNQSNPEFKKLFSYCLKNNHWSPFQMASMCLHFETSLAVATQVKRHWSLAICEPADIQETSMRYIDPFEHNMGFQPIELRKPTKNNRQSSEEPLDAINNSVAQTILTETLDQITYAAKELKKLGVSNETLRMIYPQATTTRFFIAGSCRSWLHYLQMRDEPHAQKEHRELAIEVKKIFQEAFPTVYEILFSQE